jgi:hypothetical protein
MIESVDPADTTKLDEIDARVDAYKLHKEFTRFEKSIEASWEDVYKPKCPRRIIWWAKDAGVEKRHTSFIFYTRSRDALKSIRPEGWNFSVCELLSDDENGEELFGGLYSATLNFRLKDDLYFHSADCKTEELAELHAIIQAIEYERKNQ